MPRRWDKAKEPTWTATSPDTIPASEGVCCAAPRAHAHDEKPPCRPDLKLAAPPRNAKSAAPHAAGCTSGREELLSGYRVVFRDGRQGEIEFVASSGDILVSLDDGRAKDRRAVAGEEVQRTWIEGQWPEQCWASPGDGFRVVERKHRLRERRDVADYRHALRCLACRRDGIDSERIALEIGRPKAWVEAALQRGTPQKPKNLEHWDSKGFSEVRYLKRRYHEDGLYENIVQGVEWQQDRVWRVHKEADGQWDLRTVKQCPVAGCGRTLQRVPETAVKIGPHDSRGAPRTKPHSNWRCEKQGPRCMKTSFGSAIADDFYWWCPTHKWYVCQECQKDIEDKPTSKQIRGWYFTECPALDNLVFRIIRDFNLPDPQVAPGGTARYTIKMNWYPDGQSQVTDHRHDVWTVLVSLGSPRVLNVDHARVLMEDGDAILFGTQRHGVPPAPPTTGGRLSLVLMFQPDPRIEAAALRLAAGQEPLESAIPRSPESPDNVESDIGELVATLSAAIGVSEDEAARALQLSGYDAELAAALLLGAD